MRVGIFVFIKAFLLSFFGKAKVFEAECGKVMRLVRENDFLDANMLQLLILRTIDTFASHDKSSKYFQNNYVRFEVFCYLFTSMSIYIKRHDSGYTLVEFFKAGGRCLNIFQKVFTDTDIKSFFEKRRSEYTKEWERRGDIAALLSSYVYFSEKNNIIKDDLSCFELKDNMEAIMLSLVFHTEMLPAVFDSLDKFMRLSSTHENNGA